MEESRPGKATGSGDGEARGDYSEQTFTAKEGAKVVGTRMFIIALFTTVNN